MNGTQTCSHGELSGTQIHFSTYKKRTGMAVKKARKKAEVKAPAAKKKAAAAVSKKYTKTEILNEIATNTNLNKKQVGAVIDELSNVIQRHISKKGVGEFTLPGLLKIKSVVRPARPARKNVPNPFKPGELMDIPKKPATTRVKVLPLKKLKEFAM
jgi:nucleoid DNA-binding protein